LHALVTGEIKGKEGETFKAGRLGEYTIGNDTTPTALGLNVLYGSPFIYNKDNIDNFNW
jgi:rhamnose transport system substrate-binding protein